MELDKHKEDDQVALCHALLITPFMSNSHRLCQLQKNKQGLIPSSKTSALFRVRREEISENAVHSWILPGLEQWEWWGDVTAGPGGIHLKKHESPALTPIWLHLSQFISLWFHPPCFQELRPLPKCWQVKWVGCFSAHMCLSIRHFSLGKKKIKGLIPCHIGQQIQGMERKRKFSSSFSVLFKIQSQSLPI